MLYSYRDYPAMNQSALSAMTHGLHRYIAFKEKETDPSRATTIGSIVDLLLENKSPTEVYIFDDIPECTGTIKEIYDEFRQHGDFDNEELLLELSYKHYNNNWSKETRLKKLEEKKEYIEFWKKYNADDIIYPKEWYETAVAISLSLTTHPHTEKLVMKTGFYQQAIYFEINGTPCKALLDKIIIDPDKKIIRPIDFKTMEKKTTKFIESVIQWRYDIQASFYLEAIKQEYPDYKILPFTFIVESSTYQGCPLVYECSDEFIHNAKWGTPELMGWMEALERIKWHESNDKWLYSREIYESNGRLVL